MSDITAKYQRAFDALWAEDHCTDAELHQLLRGQPTQKEHPMTDVPFQDMTMDQMNSYIDDHPDGPEDPRDAEAFKARAVECVKRELAASTQQPEGVHAIPMLDRVMLSVGDVHVAATPSVARRLAAQLLNASDAADAYHAEKG